MRGKEVHDNKIGMLEKLGVLELSRKRKNRNASCFNRNIFTEFRQKMRRSKRWLMTWKCLFTNERDLFVTFMDLEKVYVGAICRLLYLFRGKEQLMDTIKSLYDVGVARQW